MDESDNYKRDIKRKRRESGEKTTVETPRKRACVEHSTELEGNDDTETGGLETDLICQSDYYTPTDHYTMTDYVRPDDIIGLCQSTYLPYDSGTEYETSEEY